MSEPTTTMASGAALELAAAAFRKSLPDRMVLQEVLRGMGDVTELECLDVGAVNPMFSYYLRKAGGNWNTVVARERDGALFDEILKTNVHRVADGRMPFEKKQFDVVVIVGYLEECAADEAFIAECHRVLKSDGRLVLVGRRVNELSLVPGLRRLLGVTAERLGVARDGYTERELFNIVKDGFDMHSMRTFSRFLVECLDAIVTGIRLRRGLPGGIDRATTRLLGALAPLYALFAQLDMLGFFLRGHRYVAVSVRRAWRPRKTPILVDGRSISEAVLRPRG